MARILFISAVLSALFISTFAISPYDLSHIPTDPICYTPLAGAENTHAASYVYDAVSFFHPSPNRLVVPDQAPEQITANPLLAAVMPYAQQYMGHRTRNIQNQKNNGAVADSSSGSGSNTTVHAWFIIFLVILGGLALTAHYTVKSSDDAEKKEKERLAAEQAEKDKFKRSLIVGPLETIEVPMEDDGEIIREGNEIARFDEGQEGGNRYVNPNYYSTHENEQYAHQENTYAQQENNYSQQDNNNYTYQENGYSHHQGNGYSQDNNYSHHENNYSHQENGQYENQEPVVHYGQGQNGYGSSNYEQEQQHQGHQQNGQYYDDRQALGQYGASQGPSDYGQYQYDDDQDLANLVDDEK